MTSVTEVMAADLPPGCLHESNYRITIVSGDPEEVTPDA